MGYRDIIQVETFEVTEIQGGRFGGLQNRTCRRLGDKDKVYNVQIRHAHQRCSVALRFAQSFGVQVTNVGAIPEVDVHGVEHPCQSRMGVRYSCHLGFGLDRTHRNDEKLPGGRYQASHQSPGREWRRWSDWF